MTLPTLGKTLRGIAEGGSQYFYTGKVAEKMESFVQEHGGWLATEDLASHTSDWDEAISVGLPRGYLLGMSAQRPGDCGVGGVEHRRGV